MNLGFLIRDIVCFQGHWEAGRRGFREWGFLRAKPSGADQSCPEDTTWTLTIAFPGQGHMVPGNPDLASVGQHSPMVGAGVVWELALLKQKAGVSG